MRFIHPKYFFSPKFPPKSRCGLYANAGYTPLSTVLMFEIKMNRELTTLLVLNNWAQNFTVLCPSQATVAGKCLAWIELLILEALYFDILFR